VFSCDWQEEYTMFAILELGGRGGDVIDYRRVNHNIPGDHTDTLHWITAERDYIKANHPGVEVYGRMVSSVEMVRLLSAGKIKEKSGLRT
jgi:hypothetical protein